MKKVRIKFLHVLHFNKMKKGLINWDMPIYLIIAFVLLVIMIGVYLVVSDKLTNAIDYMRNILRFGG